MKYPKPILMLIFLVMSMLMWSSRVMTSWKERWIKDGLHLTLLKLVAFSVQLLMALLFLILAKLVSLQLMLLTC